MPRGRRTACAEVWAMLQSLDEVQIMASLSLLTSHLTLALMTVIPRVKNLGLV